jgi:hypothetical protein
VLARGLADQAGCAGAGDPDDRHIPNAYCKIGVSTRVAATLFAMEHGLIAWRELPFARPTIRS